MDWDDINHQLSNYEWGTILGGDDPNDMLNRLLSIILAICESRIPTKRKRTVRNSIIPKDQKILMRRRAILNKKLTKTTSTTKKESLLSRVATIERELKESHTKQRSKEGKQAMENIKTNPKFFYSYCKKFSKANTKIGPLQSDEGVMSSTSLETCNILAKQYTKAFSQPDTTMTIPNPKEFFTNQNPNLQLVDIQFGTTEITQAISELSMNSAAGPDGLPAILLIKCKEVLATPLQMIWRQSLDTGIIPSVLKTAIISPIYKGGDRSQAKNYRSVALTSHLIKIFEKIIRNAIMKFMEDNGLMSNTQHGFRRGRSCLSNLLSHYEWLLQGLAGGQNVDIVYLDFSKAFDRVDHGILLHKLKAMGVTGRLGVWIHSFLTSRTQEIAVNGYRSYPTDVISGVPQGSVLGPLLFLILMGDIDQAITHPTFISSFADDTTLSHRVKSEADVQILQSSIKNISTWAKENNMKFNEEKFELLRCGSNQALRDSISLCTGSDQIISPSNTVKCLGVHFQKPHLSHCEKGKTDGRLGPQDFHVQGKSTYAYTMDSPDTTNPRLLQAALVTLQKR